MGKRLENAKSLYIEGIRDGNYVEAIHNYAGERYTQHSTAYEEIHNVVGCGSFVAVLSKMDLAGSKMAVIDLFRVQGGLIVEHWDVMEEILPKDRWVNSGKF